MGQVSLAHQELGALEIPGITLFTVDTRFFRKELVTTKNLVHPVKVRNQQTRLVEKT